MPAGRYLMTNTVYTDESGVQYEIDGFGIARLSSIDYEEGWNCLDDGSYMYVESGRILTSTVEWLPDYQTGEENNSIVHQITHKNTTARGP